MSDEEKILKPHYLIEVSYVGTPFNGWQSQTNGTGVQDVLEKALGTILRHPVRLTGSSRTDSGVHAEQQFASFRTNAPFDERRWIYSLRGLVPFEIGIHMIRPVADSFHPVRAARAKAYRYRIWNSPTRNAFLNSYCWHFPFQLDLDLMRREAESLIGRHDFTAFCAADSTAKTRDRTILEVHFERRGHLIEFWIVGEGFLKQMVRHIVGTLIRIGEGKLGRGTIQRLLQGRTKTPEGLTAPAKGLCLAAVYFDQIDSIALLRERSAQALSFGLGSLGDFKERD